MKFTVPMPVTYRALYWRYVTVTILSFNKEFSQGKYVSEEKWPKIKPYSIGNWVASKSATLSLLLPTIKSPFSHWPPDPTTLFLASHLVCWTWLNARVLRCYTKTRDRGLSLANHWSIQSGAISKKGYLMWFCGKHCMSVSGNRYKGTYCIRYKWRRVLKKNFRNSARVPHDSITAEGFGSQLKASNRAIHPTTDQLITN